MILFTHIQQRSGYDCGKALFSSTPTGGERIWKICKLGKVEIEVGARHKKSCTQTVKIFLYF